MTPVRWMTPGDGAVVTLLLWQGLVRMVRALLLCQGLVHMVRAMLLCLLLCKKCHELCVQEVLAFIAHSIAIGMLHLPRVRDYWSMNTILAMPWFPLVMSRDHFLIILRYIHLVDSSQQKKAG